MQSRRDGLADDAIIRARAPVHAVISVASEFIIRSVDAAGQLRGRRLRSIGLSAG